VFITGYVDSILVLGSESDPTLRIVALTSKLKRLGLVGGTLVVFFGLGIESVLSLATNILLGRSFGSADYGIITTALTTLSLCVTFMMLGLDTAIARFIPQEDTTDARRSVFFSSLLVVGPLVCCVAIIGVALSWFDITIFRYTTRSITVLGIIAIAVPFSALSNLAVAYMRGMEMPVLKTTVQSVIEPVLVFAVVILSIALGLNVTSLAWGYLLVFVVSAVAACLLLWLKTDFRPYGQFDVRTRSLLSFSIPVVATTGIKSIFTDTDIYLIGFFSGVQQVGLYKSGYVLAKFLGFTLMAFNFLFLPRISRHLEEDRLGKVNQLYSRTATWLVLLTFPPFLLLIIFPETIIRLTFGTAYVPATIPLLVLALAYFTHSVMGPNGTLLMSTGNVRFLFAATAFASITNILLNLELIPEYGILGAAVSTLVSYLSLNLLLLVFIWRVIGITHLSKQYLSLVITAAVLALGYVGVADWFGFILKLKLLAFVAILVIFFVITFATGALNLDLVREELLDEESD